jgi:5-methylcytosine-specific restriction endonuclease McrBC regulatory subunit McrC
MPTLFERFVASWLTRHLPSHWTLNSQETVAVHNDANLRFRIDMVLYNSGQQAVAVLDTKYKWSSKIAAADVHQLVTYAKLKRCHHAILIYPSSTDKLAISVDDIHLKAYSFALAGDIHTMGQTLLNNIFTGLGLDPAQSLGQSPNHPA